MGVLILQTVRQTIDMSITEKSEKMLKKLFALCKKAGKIILSKDSTLDIDEKLNNKDVVTQYDKAVQSYLERRLLKMYPEIRFLGEEGDGFGKVDPYSGEIFIIDPIDGTNNFVHSTNFSAISIAYVKDGDTVLGLVYNPYSNEFFYAVKGVGAFLNGKKISMPDLPLSSGLVGLGTAVYYDELVPKTKRAISDVLDAAIDIRRLGSAALEMCYLAAGKLVGFFEMRLAPWDYAATMLIIKEAGGIVTDIDGKELSFTEKSSVVAGTKSAYPELIEILRKT